MPRCDVATTCRRCRVQYSFPIRVRFKDFPVFFGVHSRVRSRWRPVRASHRLRLNTGSGAGRSHHFGESVTNLVSEPGNPIFAVKKPISPPLASPIPGPATPTVHGVVQPRLFVRRSFVTPPAAAGRPELFERNCLMSSQSFFIRSLGVAATLAAVTFCSLNARAEIVFGNLGATGTAGLSSTNTDFGPSSLTTLALAQGFTTGTSNLTLQSVTLGLFAASSPATLPRTVALYSSASNQPNSLIGTSSTVQVGEAGKYTFAFSIPDLSPNTSYWIVPEQGSSWYLNAVEDQPVGLNASGYSYLGTKRQTIANPGTWVNSALPYSVSVEAVPEPSSIVMAGLGGLGLLAIERNRRRRRKAVHADAVEADDYLG
jgi:hypothetical protein